MAADPMPLSEREREILCLVATGVTNQEIACRLIISVNTVKVHLRNIFGKIGVESRTEASMWAVKYGLVEVPAKDGSTLAAGPSDGASVVAADEEAVPEIVATPAMPAAELRALRPSHVISLGQRLYLIASIVVVVALAIIPPLVRAPVAARGDSLSAFSDSRSNGETNSLAPISRWRTRAQMPSSRTRLAVAAVGGWVYAIGGDSGGLASNAVEAYNARQNLWEIRSAKPTAVSNVGAAVVRGLVYVPGGMTAEAQPTDVLEVYDPAHDKWSSLSPLPAPLCAYGVAAVDTRVYLFGGWDGTAYSSQVHIYDTVADRWTLGTPMSVARGFAGTGVIGERMYVVGGYDERQELSRCDEYDPAREGSERSPWRERAPMSVGRGGVAVATVGDMLFAIGGGWQNYVAYNERYDPHSNAWFSFDSPVLGQWRNLGVAAVDVNLYAVGGWSGKDLDTNEEYQAIYRVVVPMGRP